MLEIDAFSILVVKTLLQNTFFKFLMLLNILENYISETEENAI